MDTDYATATDDDLHDGIIEEPSRAEGIAASHGIEVRSGIGMEGLSALRDHWLAIVATQPNVGFHHAYEWHLSYLRHLEQDKSSIHFYSFFRNGRPIAIFPLRHVRRRSAAGIPLWLWELPVHPHMNLCDCVMAREEADGAALARLLVDTLGRRDLPWDALHLPNLLDNASALKALHGAALPRTLFVRAGESMYFPCADIASAMSHCTPKFKKNLRRQRKKLDQLGRVELSLAQDQSALADAFADFLRLEASGWKGSGGRGSAIMLHPHLLRFYRNLVDSFAADGRCLIGLLKLDGVAIAAQFGIVAGKTLYLLKIAYDEAFRAVAPGNQLLQDVLKHCCVSSSLARLSLVTGPAWAVGRWNPEVHGRWDAYVFNSNVRGLPAYAAMRLKSSAAAVAKSRPSW